MPDLLLVYGKPSENVASLATLELDSGAANANYPLSYLVDGYAHTPFLSAAISTAVFIHGTFSGAQRIDVVFIPMHNIPAGTNVRFRMHASDDRTNSTVNAAVTVDAWGSDGMPPGIYCDLTGVSGYSSGGFQHFWLEVPSIAQIVAIGELVLYSRKRTFRPFLLGESRSHRRIASVHRTSSGGRIGVVDRRSTERGIRGRLVGEYSDQNTIADLLTLYQDCKGPVSPFMAVQHADSTHAGLWVEWTEEEFAPVYEADRYIPVETSWRERSRGRILPTAA